MRSTNIRCELGDCDNPLTIYERYTNSKRELKSSFSTIDIEKSSKWLFRMGSTLTKKELDSGDTPNPKKDTQGVRVRNTEFY